MIKYICPKNIGCSRFYILVYFFVNVCVCVFLMQSPRPQYLLLKPHRLSRFHGNPQEDDETVWHYSVRCISDVTSLCRPALMQGCFAPKANMSILEVGWTVNLTVEINFERLMRCCCLMVSVGLCIIG